MIPSPPLAEKNHQRYGSGTFSYPYFINQDLRPVSCGEAVEFTPAKLFPKRQPPAEI